MSAPANGPFWKYVASTARIPLSGLATDAPRLRFAPADDEGQGGAEELPRRARFLQTARPGARLRRRDDATGLGVGQVIGEHDRVEAGDTQAEIGQRQHARNDSDVGQA